VAGGRMKSTPRLANFLIAESPAGFVLRQKIMFEKPSLSSSKSCTEISMF
jgi:hypothetical protein